MHPLGEAGGTLGKAERNRRLSCEVDCWIRSLEAARTLKAVAGRAPYSAVGARKLLFWSSKFEASPLAWVILRQKWQVALEGEGP